MDFKTVHQEFLKTGRKYKRPGKSWSFYHVSTSYVLVEDAIADDWEQEPLKVPMSESDALEFYKQGRMDEMTYGLPQRLTWTDDPKPLRKLLDKFFGEKP